MSGDISRDPDKYILSDHARQQMKDRNIGWHEIGVAIEDGDIIPSPEEGSHGFRLYFPGPDLKVIAGTEDPLGRIDDDENLVKTVTWESGEEKGGRL